MDVMAENINMQFLPNNRKVIFEHFDEVFILLAGIIQVAIKRLEQKHFISDGWTKPLRGSKDQNHPIKSKM
uniref:Uncharacterized protein n=1 Tax=Candidatus Kentrum sp. LPFa TaxID=2126335 RepID=A0A450WEG3_9GAMM|nr:MAG: hypothetical protein BECKLPF1236A_GA0070988_101254 [Candidatus Kentron sp. LPFa]VFK31352.1 MAG: hypothetical protein BECKLPF1236C_GA0070990_101364 [Candidatus Kentron sp. LPFa]